LGLIASAVTAMVVVRFSKRVAVCEGPPWSPTYFSEEFSLSNWLAHTPPKLVAQYLKADEATIAKWLVNAPGIMPKA